MDPTTIAIIGTLLCALLLKGVMYLATPKAISAGKDYDRRFEDDKYVAMIHATRKGEMENFGEYLTECGCWQKSCKPTPIPPKGEGRPGEAYAWPTPATKPTYWKRRIGGFLFSVPYDMVPEHAHGTLDNGPYGSWAGTATFTWTDSLTGQRMARKVMSVPEIRAERYEIMSDQYEKPIMTFDAATDSFMMPSGSYEKMKSIEKMLKSGVITSNEAREALEDLGLMTRYNKRLNPGYG